MTPGVPCFPVLLRLDDGASGSFSLDYASINTRSITLKKLTYLGPNSELSDCEAANLIEFSIPLKNL